MSLPFSSCRRHSLTGWLLSQAKESDAEERRKGEESEGRGRRRCRTRAPPRDTETGVRAPFERGTVRGPTRGRGCVPVLPCRALRPLARPPQRRNSIPLLLRTARSADGRSRLLACCPPAFEPWVRRWRLTGVSPALPRLCPGFSAASHADTSQ